MKLRERGRPITPISPRTTRSFTGNMRGSTKHRSHRRDIVVRNAVRPELAMEIDDAIVQLAAKLDAWLDNNLATISSMDRVAQFKALLAGIEITKELDHLKAKGLAAITALLNRQDAVTDDERAASLIRGFEFAAKLEATLKDEL